MIDIFNSIESQLLTAFVLGLAVALNPCIIAANGSTLSYMTEGFNKKEKLTRCCLYSLGRIIAFTLLGTILYLFADTIAISQWIQLYFGKIIGPAFIIIGLILLNIIHIHAHINLQVDKIGSGTVKKKIWFPLLVGFIIAFAFCPESGALYFGTMVPLLSKCSLNTSIAASLCFSIGAVLPLIPIASVLISGSKKLEEIKSKHGNIELYVRRLIAALFIIAGLLFVYEYYID